LNKDTWGKRAGLRSRPVRGYLYLKGHLFPLLDFNAGAPSLIVRTSLFDQVQV
jgi:hypothetical protein